MEGLRVQIICNKKLRGEMGERGRKRVSCTDLSLRRIWIAFVFTTTQGCVVCQCLALIMGFVSVRLRKWHARVRWCVCVSACVCCCMFVCEAESTRIWKKMYIHAGDYIFKRGWDYVHLNVSTHQIHRFLSAPVQLNKCDMGSWAGTSMCARFFIR